jgi:hypothetical protein
MWTVLFGKIVKANPMKGRNKPVLVPFNLKWKDFAWLIAFSLLAVIVFLLSSSKATAQVPSFSNVDFVTYQKDSSFSISIPDYLVEVSDLNAQASIQFKNTFNETYLMVVTEEKSETGHANMNQLEDHFKSNLLQKGGLLTKEIECKVNNFQSVQNEVEWMVDGEALAYLITFIDTPQTLYKIYCWTQASHKEYLIHFKQATDSFVVINNLHSKI